MAKKRNRKKKINNRPSVSLLGSGFLRNAGNALSKRQQTINEQIANQSK